MATYRVISWRGIPTAVRATDESGASVTRPLPPSFQQEVDRVAMAEGITGSDDYLEAWSWSAEAQRDGAAAEVAETLAAELAAAWRQQARPPPGEPDGPGLDSAAGNAHRPIEVEGA